MHIDRQHSIRQILANEPDVQVMPAIGRVCVVHTLTISESLSVRAMLAPIGVYVYRAVPANLRGGYYTIFIL